MMFPALQDWQSTSWGLHQATMLIAPIQKALFTVQRNYLHLSLQVEASGVRSQTLPQGGHIAVNFKNQTLSYIPSNSEPSVFALENSTQARLFDELFAVLKNTELASVLGTDAQDATVEDFLRRLYPTNLEYIRGEMTHQDPIHLNATTASHYADVLYSVYTAIARFRGRLEGHMTPMVIWPEHFDLSTLWFHPDNVLLDDHKPHINIGFAPYTPHQYDYPYLYVYAYPYPDPFVPPTLPAPWVWHLDGWRGAVLTYETMQGMASPESAIEALLNKLMPQFIELMGR